MDFSPIPGQNHKGVVGEGRVDSSVAGPIPPLRPPVHRPHLGHPGQFERGQHLRLFIQCSHTLQFYYGTFP